MSQNTTTVILTKQADKKYSVKCEEDVAGKGAARGLGTVYIQKWFAEDAQSFEVTITRK